MSRMDSFMNLSPLNTTVPRKIISFSDISAVNFIVGWNELACSMKRSTSFLLQSQREKTSSMFPFSWLGIVLLH